MTVILLLARNLGTNRGVDVRHEFGDNPVCVQIVLKNALNWPKLNF